MARQHFTLRRLVVGSAALLLGCALGGGIAVAAGTTQASKPASVQLGDNFFKPDHLTVSAGTKVTWTWTGNSTHNVTVVSGPQKFRSVDQASGTFSRVMSKPGVYKIVCTFHPGMDLTLTVRKAKTPRATTTTASPPSS
ncbi:MAG TPA: plastocyanin/azurin family copper-binding protein [Acidimicrobiia bacterium]|nr:plastocyanin/azurin family copper-binding protein [Acidimicrobiia bacterium]